MMEILIPFSSVFVLSLNSFMEILELCFFVCIEQSRLPHHPSPDGGADPRAVRGAERAARRPRGAGGRAHGHRQDVPHPGDAGQLGPFEVPLPPGCPFDLAC